MSGEEFKVEFTKTELTIKLTSGKRGKYVDSFEVRQYAKIKILNYEFEDWYTSFILYNQSKPQQEIIDEINNAIQQMRKSIEEYWNKVFSIIKAVPVDSVQILE